MIMMLRFLLSITALSVSLSCHAGSLQEQPLKALETPHFKLFYPENLAALAQNAANELENSQQLLEQHQQRRLVSKAEVVLFDPNNAPNGFALPLSHQPTMALFATPPQSDMVLHHMTGWMQLVALHEYVHLVHLAQPHRREWQNQAGKYMQFADLLRLQTPRWASEGYATLLESRLTGYGRLYSHFAEAWLQQLALEGALPEYNTLNSSKGRYQASGFAYLVGSRFLAWLEQQYGSAQLDAVWTRLIAKKSRTFEQAFSGIYGVSPASLYQRFAAEYSFQALQQQRQLPPLTAQLWHDSKGRQQAPALSPDRKMLALIEEDKADLTELVVLSTAENSKAAAEFVKVQQEIQQADPADITDVQPAVFQREIKHRLEPRNLSKIRDPRWLDNHSIVFGGDTKDADGMMRQDLYRWDLQTGAVTALSTEQNLRRFDVSADGRFIIAERSKDGFAQLVRLDLASGVLTELTAAELEHVYDFPRLTPDQQQFAVVHFVQGQGWQLELRASSDARLLEMIPLPQGYQYLSYPSWSLDGKSLFYVASQHHRLKLYQYDLQSKKLTEHSSGAEMIQMVQPRSDNRLLAQLVNQQGPDLYEVTLTEGRLVPSSEQVLTPVITESAGQKPWLVPQQNHSSIGSVSAQSRYLATKSNSSVNAAALNAKSASEVRVIDHLQMPPPQQYDQAPVAAKVTDYGLGPQQMTLVLHQHYSTTSPGSTGVGFKGGDLLKRVSYQWGYSKDTSRDGFSAHFAQGRYQAWPIKVALTVADVDLSLARQSGFTSAAERSDGGVLSFSYPWQQQELSLSAEMQLRQLDQHILTENGDSWFSPEQSSWTFNLQQDWHHQRNSWAVTVANQASWHQSRSSAQHEGWRGLDVTTSVGGRYQDISLQMTYLAQRRWQTEALLRLGGYLHPALLTSLDPNRIPAEELTFQQQTGQDYQRLELSLSDRSLEPLQFVYRRHEFANQPTIDSYGISLKGNIGLPLGPVALNDLQLRAGVFRVEPAQGQSDTRAWLSVDYQF
ncbi:hypothetical protein A5320_18730 [Rheinheimera sp. SA_1]|nr:hypothetical protein A5320_18730 [Rheinheimera sp. SA_1]